VHPLVQLDDDRIVQLVLSASAEEEIRQVVDVVTGSDGRWRLN
jgi:trans-2-enoyl-CoA reductase